MSKFLIIEIDDSIEELWNKMFTIANEETGIKEEEVAKKMFIVGLTRWACGGLDVEYECLEEKTK